MSRQSHGSVSVNEAGSQPSTPELGPINQMKASSGGETREQRVQIAAHQRYEARSREPGHDVEDWLAAEADAGAPSTIQGDAAARDTQHYFAGAPAATNNALELVSVGGPMKHAGNDEAIPQAIAPAVPGSAAALERARGNRSVPEIVVLAFSIASAGLRRRVLGRLLQSVGTLALAVIGGGAFVKCLSQTHLVSVEDAALVTSGQVFELASYVQQSNPAVVEQVLRLLSQDVSSMSALGASIAALAMNIVARRPAKLEYVGRRPAKRTKPAPMSSNTARASAKG